jgi:hypothetical protein
MAVAVHNRAINKNNKTTLSHPLARYESNWPCILNELIPLSPIPFTIYFAYVPSPNSTCTFWKKGQKQASKSYEYKLRPTNKRKGSILFGYKKPLLYSLF